MQVVVSVPSTRLATRMARALLQQRLCACVQTIGPITSHYRWKGKIERGREWLLLIKTRAPLLSRLEAAVLDLHPYDVPEILTLPVHSAHEPYARWLLQECAPQARRKSGGEGKG